MTLIAVVKANKIWKCGCYSPARGRITPCQTHAGPGVPAGTARLQNQRLYRMSKSTSRVSRRSRSRGPAKGHASLKGSSRV